MTVSIKNNVKVFLNQPFLLCHNGKIIQPVKTKHILSNNISLESGVSSSKAEKQTKKKKKIKQEKLEVLSTMLMSAPKK